MRDVVFLQQHVRSSFCVTNFSKSCGFLEQYNPDYDRVSTRSEKLLERTSRTFFNVSTSDDPVLTQLASQVSGGSEEIHVFATDTIVSHLMASPRSVYPWDIIVKRQGNKIFLDKRDGSWFDFLTVNENATEPPTDDSRDAINSPGPLGKEATFINQNFSQQILMKVLLDYSGLVILFIFAVVP